MIRYYLLFKDGELVEHCFCLTEATRTAQELGYTVQCVDGLVLDGVRYCEKAVFGPFTYKGKSKA